MPVTLLNAAAAVGNNTTSVPITVGASPTAGDLRIVRVECAASRTLSTPSGWTALYNSTSDSVSRRVAIFYRVLTGSDTNTTCTMGSSGGWGTASITIRGRDTAQTLASTTTGSTSNSSNLVAPSISVSGPGVLLTWHDITDTTSGGANTSTQTVPSGMTRLAYTASDSTAGFNIGLNYEVETAAGTTGTRTAVSSTSGTWSGTSMFIADGSATITASAALSSTSTLSASGTPGRAAAAALTSTTTLTAAAQQGQQAAAALTSASTLAATAQQGYQAAAALTSTSTLTAGATPGRPAAAALTSATVLAAAASVDQRAAAALTSTTFLAAQAGQQAAAALTSSTVLAAAARQDHSARAALSSLTTLTVGVRQTHQVAAAIASTTVLDSAATRGQPAAAALSSATELRADGTRVKIGAAQLSSTTTLAVGSIIRSAVAAAALASSTTLTARAGVAAGGGLNPSLWAKDPVTGRLVPLPHPVKLSVTDVANDVGAISVDYPAFGRGFDLLQTYVTDQRDLEVEVWLEGNRATRMVGRLDQRSGDDVSEGAVWSFTGTLITARLGETVIAPQPLVGETTLGPDVEVTKASVTAAQWSRLYALGYRTSDTDTTTVRVPQKVIDAVKANAVDIPKLADPKREAKFESATPGSIMLFLLGQSWARGAVTDLTIDFTGAKDSAGVAWPEVLTAKWSPGVTLLQVAQRLVELGLMEFTVTPDRVLRCWRFGARGTDRTVGPRPVTLRRGQNLLQAGRRQGVRGAGTDFYVAGGDGAYTSSADLNARARRGRVVEVSDSVGNITEPGALTAAAQRIRDAGVRGEDERSLALALGAGMPRPGRTIAVGDKVRVDTAGTLGVERLAQWTVSLEQQGITADVVVGDLIRSRAAALLKRLADTNSGETVVGTSTAPEDRGVPAAPGKPTVGSQAFLDGGDVYASVTAGWGAVQVNTDGTAATDLASYRVEWALQSAPNTWQLGADVDASRTSASWAVAPATPIQVRVRAQDRSGNVSQWSPFETHLTEDDATPPAVPSALVGSDYLGTLRWTWDGKTSDGADMLSAYPDFAHVELSMGASAAYGDSTVIARLFAAGTWTIADLPYGTTQYAWLVAVDRSGNRSAPSAAGSATPAKVVGDDVFAGAIGSSQLADLAVINSKIANLAVNDAKVGGMSAGKLTAGIMSADVTVSGIFRTATTGRRTEFDNAGIRLYDLAGNTVVNFATATGSALVTGEYRTALTGARMVLNPLGSAPAEMRFYPASTNQYALIRPLTSVSTTFPNQAGIGIKGYSPRTDKQSGEVSAFPGYARMAFGAEQDEGAISSTVITEIHQVGIGGPRVQVTTAPYASYSDSGIVRLGATDNNNDFIQRAVFSIFGSGGSRDGNVKAGNVNRFSYLQYDTGALSVVNDTTWINIGANSFVVNSERSAKTELQADPFAPIPAIMGADFYSYRKVEPLVPGRENPVQIGLVVDEVPEVLRVYNEDQRSWGIDLYGATAVLWGGARVHENRIADLEREVAHLRARLDGPILEAVA